jgi:hypothetical protein
MVLYGSLSAMLDELRIGAGEGDPKKGGGSGCTTTGDGGAFDT